MSSANAAQYILVEHGVPRVTDRLPDMSRFTRLAVMARTWEDVRAIDRNARYSLRPRDVPQYGALAKLLASTVYNPIDPITLDWQASGKYDKSELLDLIKSGLKDDDDIIQQWFDGRQIMRLLNAADTWEKMLVAVRAICGEHESHPEVAAYVDSVLNGK